MFEMIRLYYKWRLQDSEAATLGDLDKKPVRRLLFDCFQIF